MHEKWVKMIQESGAPDWSTHTWYQAGTDLGAGKSAMIFDADILGYFMNGGDNAEAGNLSFAPVCGKPRCEGANAKHLDLVTCNGECIEEKGCSMVLYAVGFWA